MDAVYIMSFTVNQIIKLFFYDRSALDAQQHLRVPENEHLMVSEDEEQSELSFLKSLSKKEKKKLLL